MLLNLIVYAVRMSQRGLAWARRGQEITSDPETDVDMVFRIRDHRRQPDGSQTMRAGQKIVSAIGMTEICPVRCASPDIVEPLPSFWETGLMSAVTADGFVVVPEVSEGYPAGASVTVYLYERSIIRGQKR